MSGFDQNQLKKTDEELALAMQSGELAAFTELMRRYEEKITRYLGHLVGSTEAPDISQETFLKVYHNIQSFDATRKFSSWVYRIAHNAGVNWLRRDGQMKRLTFSFDTVWPASAEEERPIFEPADTGPTLDSNYDQKEALARAEELINKLDIKYREVLYLRYWEDFSYEQISESLRIPIATVGVRLKRAKEHLRLELAQAKFVTAVQEI